MIVLLTGGYGFIGTSVMERLHREGHEIVVIDNLSSGHAEYSSHIPHSFYRYSIEQKACAEVFRKHRIDAVIHLAAQTSVAYSVLNPMADARSNTIGLMNMLDLSCKFGVRKFVFASSAAVYGAAPRIPLEENETCNPQSPYGLTKLFGEYYCEQWHHLYGLPTLCFRFSNVYGPRQGKQGEGGVISIFLNRMLAEQELIVYGDGNQSRDFIFVEDIAEALVRAMQSRETGKFNLSSNEEHTLHRVISILSTLHAIQPIIYRDQRPGDIYRSRLSNESVKRAFDWKPHYTLEAGLARTFEWFKSGKRIYSAPHS